jgi:phosphoserine phosphatase RsbU/P
MADLDVPYKMQTFNLARGESILFFTDGITEAMDSEEEMYEDHRLESFFLANREKPARQFVDELIKDLDSFVGDAEQSDDITVFYIRRNP